LRIEALHFVLPHQSKNEHGLRRTSDNEIFSQQIPHPCSRFSRI